MGQHEAGGQEAGGMSKACPPGQVVAESIPTLPPDLWSGPPWRVVICPPPPPARVGTEGHAFSSMAGWASLSEMQKKSLTVEGRRMQMGVIPTNRLLFGRVSGVALSLSWS